MVLSIEVSAAEVLASPFRVSPFNINNFYHYDLMHPLKMSTHHWVGPRKSVSNRAPHLLTPALHR